MHGWSKLGSEVRLFDCCDGYCDDIEFIFGDVQDSKALEMATRGCDIVFHLAALLGVEKIIGHDSNVLAVNLGAQLTY